MSITALSAAVMRYCSNLKSTISQSRGDLYQGLFIDNHNGEFSLDSEPLVQRVFVVDNTTDLNTCKAIAVTNEYIFNSWQRISRGNWANSNPTRAEVGFSDRAIPSELESFTYDSGTGNFTSGVDSMSLVGFVSPNAFDQYVLDTVLKSTSTIQNDPIGLLLAYARDADGTTHTLTAIRGVWRASGAHTDYAFEIAVDAITVGWISITHNDAGLLWVDGSPASGPSPAVASPWAIKPWNLAPNGLRLKVTRAGDAFTVETGNYDVVGFVSAATINFTLNDHASLARFKGKNPYGFVAVSQDNTIWQVLTSPEPAPKIVNLADRTVHTYSAGSWTSTASTFLQAVTSGRIYFNDITKKSFHLDLNGTGRRLTWPQGVLGLRFEGEITAASFITGDDLATAISLTAGTSIHSSEPWLKYRLNGKTLYLAKKPLRSGINWNSINAVGAVFGTATVVIGGLTYKVRLLKGASVDPSTATSSFDPAGAEGSEWNQLLYHVHSATHTIASNSMLSEGITEGEWAQYLDSDLITTGAAGNGATCWCQETAAADSAQRVTRGTNGVSSLAYALANISPFSLYGWRPVLELVP